MLNPLSVLAMPNQLSGMNLEPSQVLCDSGPKKPLSTASTPPQLLWILLHCPAALSPLKEACQRATCCKMSWPVPVDQQIQGNLALIEGSLKHFLHAEQITDYSHPEIIDQLADMLQMTYLDPAMIPRRHDKK